MSLIYPVRKQIFIMTRSERNEWRTLEIERQCDREEAEKEENV